MKGTWQTTGPSGGKAVLLIAAAALLAGSGGAVAAVAAAVIDALIAVAAVVVLAVLALAVFLAHRARNPSPEGFVRTPGVRAPLVHELAAQERVTIPQHVHLHFHGADPAGVAEIIRQHQRPE